MWYCYCGYYCCLLFQRFKSEQDLIKDISKSNGPGWWGCRKKGKEIGLWIDTLFR